MSKAITVLIFVLLGFENIFTQTTYEVCVENPELVNQNIFEFDEDSDYKIQQPLVHFFLKYLSQLVEFEGIISPILTGPKIQRKWY